MPLFPAFFNHPLIFPKLKYPDHKRVFTDSLGVIKFFLGLCLERCIEFHRISKEKIPFRKNRVLSRIGRDSCPEETPVIGVRLVTSLQQGGETVLEVVTVILQNYK
jgi:hypothetical protein